MLLSVHFNIWAIYCACDLSLSRYYTHRTQECIPVGCVPAAHWPYAAVLFLAGGGVCLVRGGVLLGPGGGDLAGPGGVLLGPGGFSLVPGGVLLGPGGGCLVGGGWVGIPACTEADTLPPPVDRILDTRLWKYYLGPTSLRPVKIMRLVMVNEYLPCVFFLKEFTSDTNLQDIFNHFTPAAFLRNTKQ